MFIKSPAKLFKLINFKIIEIKIYCGFTTVLI